MSSKRGVRRRSCGRKNAYRDEATALGVVVVARKRGHRLHAYHCDFADHWHVGHPTGRMRQAMAARRRTAREAA